MLSIVLYIMFSVVPCPKDNVIGISACMSIQAEDKVSSTAAGRFKNAVLRQFYENVRTSIYRTKKCIYLEMINRHCLTCFYSPTVHIRFYYAIGILVFVFYDQIFLPILSV